MTPGSDDIFSHTMIRLKVRFIGTVGTTVVVMHANFRENLPRGLSKEILPVGPNIPMTPSSDEIFSQTKIRLNMRFMGTLGVKVLLLVRTCQVARGSACGFVRYLSAEFATGYQ